ncbi:MAG TPA: hypothetical protein VGQ73_06395 [Gemmatimonadales bacterium]|jgi:hypothetical protein|nr:hypothetical protein [Gemmatimonadales bacterium]
MSSPERLLEPLLALHAKIRAAVVDACSRQTAEQLSNVAADDAGDTIYSIDRIAEDILVDTLGEVAREEPLLLVAEGLPGGALVLPRGGSKEHCRWQVLVDPIDGTRGLMYQKRSGWILTGVAPNRGEATRLRDIVLAVQTEIPLLKQHLSDQLWAMRSAGVSARRFDRLTGTNQPITLRPSSAGTIAHGFASIVRFFPGAREVLGGIDDEVLGTLSKPSGAGKALCFEDQYASTGGQLYELIAGHDRFIADLRPLLRSAYAKQGLPAPLCCHPYDICTGLLAGELGVILTGSGGEPLDTPFDLATDVAWVGYANASLRAAVEPVLQAALRRRGLLPSPPR